MTTEVDTVFRPSAVPRIVTEQARGFGLSTGVDIDLWGKLGDSPVLSNSLEKMEYFREEFPIDLSQNSSYDRHPYGRMDQSA